MPKLGEDFFLSVNNPQPPKKFKRIHELLLPLEPQYITGRKSKTVIELTLEAKKFGNLLFYIAIQLAIIAVGDQKNPYFIEKVADPRYINTDSTEIRMILYHDAFHYLLRELFQKYDIKITIKGQDVDGVSSLGILLDGEPAKRYPTTYDELLATTIQIIDYPHRLHWLQFATFFTIAVVKYNVKISEIKEIYLTLKALYGQEINDGGINSLLPLRRATVVKLEQPTPNYSAND